MGTSDKEMAPQVLEHPGTRTTRRLTTVARTSVAHSGTPSTTREVRALALALAYFEEIAASHRGGCYRVPSCSGEGSYAVVYMREEESCECPDWQIRGNTCKHVLCCAVIRAKTGVCSGCGARFRHRDLYPVGEDHLTYFEGDELCEACAIGAGIL